jgi:hypothetical protein
LFSHCMGIAVLGPRISPPNGRFSGSVDVPLIAMG